jgi:hypothetical protein
MQPEERERIRTATGAVVELRSSLGRLQRALERAGEAMRFFADAEVRAARREWDPELEHLLVSDEECEAMLQRSFGRTLAEIDELPTTHKH